MTATSHCSPGSSNYRGYEPTRPCHRRTREAVAHLSARHFNLTDERRGGPLHAPFRRVMKRPASDMTGGRIIAYTRGRSRRPSWRDRLFRQPVQTIRPRPFAYLSWTPGLPYDTAVYSNFILGPFGIRRIDRDRSKDGDVVLILASPSFALADA